MLTAEREPTGQADVAASGFGPAGTARPTTPMLTMEGRHTVGGTLRKCWRWRSAAVDAAAGLALGACSGDDDSSTTTSESSTTTTEASADGATTLAKGEDVELVGERAALGGQTLNVSAEEEDGEVTGEIRLTDPDGEVVVTVECADTDTDGVVVLGGTVTEADDDDISGTGRPVHQGR